MGRNEDKIKKALTSKGYVVEEVYWEPIRCGGCKEGIIGGWSVFYDLPEEGIEYENLSNVEYVVLGYNIQEVLNEIEELPTLIVKKGRINNA